LLILAAGALWGTASGYGAFGGVPEKFGILQEFFGATSLTTLTLAAASIERREKRAIQQRSGDLQFLSNTVVELLSSSALAESVQKILPALAARCNVDTATFHIASNNPAEAPRLVATYGLDDTSRGRSARQVLEARMSRIIQQSAPLLPLGHAAPHRSFEDKARPLQASFCVPIRDDKRVLSALCIASHTRTEIDRSEAQLVETVGYYIRTAAIRLRQEDKLRESEHRFRELANAVPDIVWTSKADGTLEFCNRRWFEFTGEVESVEPQVRSIVELCDPMEREELARRWSECARAGQPFEMEHHLKHHSGSYRWVLTRAAASCDPAAASVRWFGTSTDLHEKKLLEAERDALLDSERAARTEAERASRIKDDFLATLSHELRNPLNAILGWAHLLSREGTDVRKAGGIIEQSARLQAQLIDDLLDMSRIVSGKLTLHRGVVNVSEVVSTSCESMQLVAREKGVSLEAQVEPGVELACADASRITQIVVNLLTNAIKFTQRGGRVTIKVVKEGEDCVLSVCDTGEGIPADFLPHLFDRFRQADPSTTRRHGGLGIGLAITKHMATLHGGSIAAESPGIGLGATFTVRLPLAFRANEASLKAPGSSAPAIEEPSSRLVGAKIMVVEDDFPSLEFLSRFLLERGAEVIGYDRGQLALDKVNEEKPDVIISDIGMPDMDGYELARRIRKVSRENGHIPIIAVTAFARPEDEAKAFQAGFDAHLPKPLDASRLERVVVDLLDRSAPKAA
jgi:PAS domain S-box-containing protein